MTLAGRIIELYRRGARAALLLSGSGSNAEAVLSARSDYPGISFEAVVTDTPSSRAGEIASRFGLDVCCFEGSIKREADRLAYFRRVAGWLEEKRVETLIYAGFMKIAPPFFLHAFPGINLHPADLSLLDAQGLPRYRGAHAVREALLAGEPYLASSVHVVEEGVDCGQPLMISKPLFLGELTCSEASLLHEQLKKKREHALYPELIRRLARGELEEGSLPVRLA